MTTAVIPSWTLGDRIRKARTTVGMDQRQFADALGVKAGTLAGWEADNSKPRELVDIARRIEEITSVPASWILGVGSLEQRTPRDAGGRHGGLRGITAE
ncbi:helix-turn-helix domain-containing protein [Rhodococcus ruber]|uniref:helix-turn-helix domain-containing protein n=1 Tax=Rhodococcus ruber TaxID=1830 RepID=UPI00266040A6|nr:helix-turn-helix transcriptional regulator [Rhodococcus ruber]MDO1477271.1 helix-turn-helix transcriptional regulator [Rhodococcus ruber]